MYFIGYVPFSYFHLSVHEFDVFFIHVPFFRNIFFKIDPNSNEYLLVKLGVDTAEKESSYSCQNGVRQIH